MNASDNTGLGLFDDTASAVGNFPTALRGYDRTAVDDYVRTLEESVVKSRRHATQLEQQVTMLQDEVASAGDGSDSKEVDYANLGGRANDILRLAQEQARELVQNATLEAEKVKEQARREADGLRNSAAREGDAIKTGGAAQIDQLRSKLRDEVKAQVDKAKAEAESLVAAARRQAESVRREADNEAQATRQNAYLDTENLRRTVEREAAEARSKLAAEREHAVAQLKSAHDEAQQKTAALLAEATKYHSESADRLEADLAEAARIRAEALAEAEQTKATAVQEAEARIATAKKQAAAINERTQQEFAWRKQQLRRETELLHQRKQAVLSQLASLSALAEQTASAFPDLDDPSDLEGEVGDRTVMRPEMLPPAGLGEDSSAGSKASTGRDRDKASDEGDDIEIDGDATVLVAPSDLSGEGAKAK
ncbi:MAG TPA: DivIVA domain-containing protein [Propionibacteriaceae bacterium]|nr:DivIVA domain-containing protein [Propionibacteriaceae bacterium]